MSFLQPDNELSINTAFIKRLHLEGDPDITNMAVDGSVTPQRFIVEALDNQILHMLSINITVEDNGDFDPSCWGRDVVMINGLRLLLRVNGVEYQPMNLEIKTTAELYAISHEYIYLNNAPAYNRMLKATWKTTENLSMIRLFPENGTPPDAFIVVVEDDLTAIFRQHVYIEGHYDPERFPLT